MQETVKEGGKYTTEKCPRCGQPHEGLIVKRLTNPIIQHYPLDPKHPTTWHYWVPCPSNGEPIMFQDISLDDRMIALMPRSEQIAPLAYYLWEHGGRIPGKDLENWLRAEWTLTTWFRCPPYSAIREIKATWKHEIHELESRVIGVARERMFKELDKKVWESLVGKVTDSVEEKVMEGVKVHIPNLP